MIDIIEKVEYAICERCECYLRIETVNGEETGYLVDRIPDNATPIMVHCEDCLPHVYGVGNE